MGRGVDTIDRIGTRLRETTRERNLVMSISFLARSFPHKGVIHVNGVQLREEEKREGRKKLSGAISQEFPQNRVPMVSLVSRENQR